MKRYLKPIILLIFLLQWVWFLLFSMVFSKQPKRLTALIENEEPTSFVETRNYFTDLSDYAVQEDHLYILYDDAAVLEIYTLTGEYQRSYVFPWFQNGKGELLVVEDALWLIDRKDNRYLFRDGQYIEAAPDHEYTAYSALKNSAKSQSDARRSADGAVYSRRGPTIYRSCHGSSAAVVKRPFYDIMMQGMFPLIQHWVVLMLLAGVVIHNKRDSRKNAAERRTQNGS